MAHYVKFNPFAPVSFNSLLDNVLHRSISDLVGSDLTTTHPTVNIVDTKDAYKIELAAPGLEKEDFKLNIEKDQLVISAQKEQKEVKEDERYTRREFNYTSFKRSFTLPETIDLNNVVANYTNGVLVLTLPKKTETKEDTSRTIEIK